MNLSPASRFGQLRISPFALIAAGALAFGAGCQGEIGPQITDSAEGPSTNGGGGPGDNPGATMCVPEHSLASARVLLLSDVEYTNIIRDAFGIEFVPEGPPASTYSLDESATVATGDVARKYYRAADQVAGKLQPCGASALAAPCVESFLRQKLPRAWKRPVTDAEMSGLMAIFNSGLANGRAMSLVMRAALGTGAFLYRTEVGEDASAASGSVALTPYELANALSFAVLGSVADDQLWAKAADGTITQPDVLSAEVDRLFSVQRARDAVSKKVSYYLNVEAITAVDKSHAPEFTPTLRSSLYQSAQLFIGDLIWKGGSIDDLLTSNKFYANAEIASVYGLPPVQGNALVPVEMPAQRNAGFLTHPGLLATTDPKNGTDDIVHRGLWIYRNLVCGQTIPEPPANATSIAAGLMGTDRVKAQTRDGMAMCKGCHAFFDPFGFASMNFDSIGRYRTTDPQDNMPVWTQATIAGVGPDMDGPISSLQDVADRLKTGRRLADCVAANLAQYTLTHNPALENSCALQQIKDDFAKSKSVVGLVRAILTSPAFKTRDL
jgi:hypothetical protein